VIDISITEKAWDAVRPGSVKKTGLSEAIRGFTKANPASGLTTPQAFDVLDKAIEDLKKSIADAAKQVAAAPKDDKKGAAAKLKGWADECAKALVESQKQRTQAGVLQAVAEAQKNVSETFAGINKNLDEGRKMLVEIKGGKTFDPREIARVLQSVNTGYRDCNKFSQKDGFKGMIATYKAVMAWKVDTALVPLPPICQQIKAQLPAIEKLAAELRVAAEKAINADGRSRSGSGADLAKKLVVDYRKVGIELKGTIPGAKKYAADVKAFADDSKLVIKAGTDPAAAIKVVEKLYEDIHALDERTMKACARGRTANGDLHRERLNIRDSLDKTSDTYKQFEKICGDEWAVVMAIYQQVSAEVGKCYLQVERLLRLISTEAPAAAGAAKALLTRLDSERKGLISKYS
jgi:hypothetical protein